MKCWVCNGSNFTMFKNGVKNISSSDFKITDARYGTTMPLYKCTGCGFLQADTEGCTISSFYKNLEDIEYTASGLQRQKQFRSLLKHCSKYINSEKPFVLDIGAGTGLFVNETLKLGWDVQGIEPSVYLSSEAQKTGLPVYTGTFPHHNCTGPYNAVFLTDVIEHIENPLSLLSAIPEYLTDNGIVVIVTPDVSSVMAKILGKKWWHYRIAHIGYFNKKTLNKIMQAAGFSPLCLKRAVWYFSISYMLERIVQYLPVLSEVIKQNRHKTAFSGKLFVPVNFFDSYIGIFKKELHYA